MEQLFAINDAEKLHTLGLSFFNQGDYYQAVQYLQRAVKLSPKTWHYLINLGIAFAAQTHYDKAIQCFKKSIQIQPTAESYLAWGTALYKQKKLKLAINYYQKALQLDAQNSEIHFNLASVLEKLNQPEIAITHYQKALTVVPQVKIHINMGIAFQRLGDHLQALTCFQAALELSPASADAAFSLGLLQLLMGNYIEGWPNYERRLLKQDFFKRTLKKPRWDGSPLNGRTLFVYSEQGLGDTLQFIRYLLLIQGGTVVFECQPALISVLKNYPSVDILLISTAEEPNIVYDVYISLMSLPVIFQTSLNTIPNQIPYLFPLAEKVEKWRPTFDSSTFNIGFTWAGSPQNPHDHTRSCQATDFLVLFDIPGVKFYSLQKGDAAKQKLKHPKVDHLGHKLHDFTDTAAVVACLDLVISVDTAIIHLAGAMGKSVWVLLALDSDWRWLLERSDSPWYPSVRLSRQTKFADWQTPIQAIKRALLEQL